MMQLSEEDYGSVDRVRETICAEAERCGPQLAATWHRLVAGLDRELPRGAQVVQLTALRGGKA